MQFFPNLLANNWYITCYLIFYLMHPALNVIINKMGQRVMLRCTLALSVMYICANYIRPVLFPSPLILWVAIYFVIAYMKLYLKNMSGNIKINCVIFLAGFIGNYGLILATNLLGGSIEFFRNKVLYWSNNCSPFLLLMVIGLFNIARNVNFKSRAVNYVSQFSLLIYIIHDNVILKAYYRPAMWQYVYSVFGHDNILGWTFIQAFILFLFSLCAGMVYSRTAGKAVTRMSGSLYTRLVKVYSYVENLLLKLH